MITVKTFISVYLLLTTTVISSRSKTLLTALDPHIEIPYRESKGLFDKDYNVAPELLDDGKFAIAVHVYNSSNVLSGFTIRLVGSEISGKCFLTMQLATIVTYWPVRRLSHKIVLVAVIGDKGRLELFTVNLQNCEYQKIYDVALPKYLNIFTSNNATDEKFSIIMYGNESCRGDNWCRLFFDPRYQKFVTLDFDFSENEVVTIESTTFFGGNVFLVRLTDATNTHKIRLYDLSTFKYKEFFFIKSDYDTDLRLQATSDTAYYNRNVRLKVYSSDKMYCWTPEYFYKFKTIHCSKFHEDGTIIFNQTLVYPGFMLLMHVQDVPNGFILISRKKYCSGWRECSIVDLSVISRKLECIDNNNCSNIDSKSMSLVDNELIQIKHHSNKLKCMALATETFNIELDEFNGSVEVQYICTSVVHVSRHRFTIFL